MIREYVVRNKIIFQEIFTSSFPFFYRSLRHVWVWLSDPQLPWHGGNVRPSAFYGHHPHPPLLSLISTSIFLEIDQFFLLCQQSFMLLLKLFIHSSWRRHCKKNLRFENDEEGFWGKNKDWVWCEDGCRDVRFIWTKKKERMRFWTMSCGTTWLVENLIEILAKLLQPESDMWRVRIGWKSYRKSIHKIVRSDNDTWRDKIAWKSYHNLG